MKDTITCYRPLGQAELDLVAASGFKPLARNIIPNGGYRLKSWKH